MFKRIKKLIVCVLAATMLFSLNTSLAFAQTNATDSIDSNASARLSFIRETSIWRKSDSNAWTEYTLNLLSALSVLTVQTMVHYPSNLNTCIYIFITLTIFSIIFNNIHHIQSKKFFQKPSLFFHLFCYLIQK